MLIIGISSTVLTPQEQIWLLKPQVSGVILFSRNFTSREQLQQLIKSIRTLRAGEFLICVDQEGGLVQRFREGFTALPPLSDIGQHYHKSPTNAIALAEMHAWVMASEIRAMDIDLSFAPVLDLQRGNRAIGERAFDANPEIVSTLSQAYVRGMRLAGMAVTLKHFPGHGSVLEDTHFDHAQDNRTWSSIYDEDLLPFRDCIAAGAEAIMMAHVSYPKVDQTPAGYSTHWIQTILRQQLKFRGIVISDDIGMAAAQSAGGVAERIHQHLNAGCDLVLVCQPTLVEEALNATVSYKRTNSRIVQSLQGLATATWNDLTNNPQYQGFVHSLTELTTQN